MKRVANRFQFALPDPRPRDGWFRVGNLDITTTVLLVAAGVASMFLYAIDKSTFFELVFHPLAVRDGDVWRLVTWPIANPPNQIWTILTLVIFWFIGHAVEDRVGRKRYTMLVVIVTIVPAVVVTLLDGGRLATYPEIGLGILSTTMFALLAADMPDARSIFFGAPIWVIAVVFLGISALGLVGDRYWGSLILMLTAIVVALVIARQWGFAERLRFIPKLGSGRSHPPRRGPAARHASQRRAPDRGRVVEGPWSSPTPPRSGPDAVAAQVELDALLDKISATGLDSLSSEEKRRLNELSKRLR